jgi:cytochrome c oxidase subunit 4
MANRTVATSTNVLVCLALLALTLLTTVLGRIPLGPWNLPIALLIAGTKALLIALYFMHLRWGPGIMRLVTAGGLLWLFILLAGVMDDYLTRAWLPIPGK